MRRSAACVSTRVRPRVRRAGSLARSALLASGGITSSLPGFEATPFRLAGDTIIWVGCDAPAHPRVALIDAPGLAEVLDIDADTEIVISASPQTLGGCGSPRDDALEAASRAILGLMSVSTPRGFAVMWMGQVPLFPLSHRMDSARGLALSSGDGDTQAFVHHATRLLGAGAGLTPSGDDFVGGALFALRAMHAQGNATQMPTRDDAALWAAAAEQIITLAHKRTHPISAALLSDLAHGESYAALHDFANALATGDDHSALSAATTVTRIGASSGWDMLAGFVAALRGSADASFTPFL